MACCPKRRGPTCWPSSTATIGIPAHAERYHKVGSAARENLLEHVLARTAEALAITFSEGRTVRYEQHKVYSVTYACARARLVTMLNDDDSGGGNGGGTGGGNGGGDGSRDKRKASCAYS